MLCRLYLEIKLDIHVLAETGRVIIAISFRVSERFEHGIATDQFIVYFLHLFLVAGRGRDKFQDLLRGFGLPRTGFAYATGSSNIEINIEYPSKLYLPTKKQYNIPN